MTERRPILALDVDGVIIEGFPKHRWDKTMKSDLGIDPSDLAAKFFVPYWRDILVGKFELRSTLSTVLKELGANISVADFIDYWHGKDARVRHDVIQSAAQWKTRHEGTIVLATNQESVRAQYLWVDLDFRKHFDHMIVSHEIEAAKPEAEYFKQADRRLARSTDQAVHFLDDLVENVEAASTHGWDAHHVVSSDAAIELIKRL